MKILVVSDLSIYALGNSYIKAFQQLGHEVEVFDIISSVNKFIKLGKLGKKIHNFLPVEAWIKKANRELAVTFLRFRPDLVIVFGNAPVQYGTVALMRSFRDCKTVLYWPDTLLNLKANQHQAASLYTLMASYSVTANPVFQRLGFQNTLWLPFAGDISLLAASENTERNFLCDLSFIGGWRPERELALLQILEAFPQIKISIKGTDWERFCSNPGLRKLCDPKPIYATAFGDFIRQSRINLNVIDDTNFPAANMRFFEIPAAGGLQLSSICPEMESIMIDGKHIFYFKDKAQMIEKINMILSRPDMADLVRKEAHKLVTERHNYLNRAIELFDFITNV